MSFLSSVCKYTVEQVGTILLAMMQKAILISETKWPPINVTLDWKLIIDTIISNIVRPIQTSFNLIYIN